MKSLRSRDVRTDMVLRKAFQASSNRGKAVGSGKAKAASTAAISSTASTPIEDDRCTLFYNRTVQSGSAVTNSGTNSKRSPKARAPKIPASKKRVGGSSTKKGIQHIIMQYDVDPYDHSDEQLINYAIEIFRHYNILQSYSIPELALRDFIDSVRQLYNPENSYHNFKHVWGVLHLSFHILINGADEYLELLDVFAVLICALCHDIGHPGNNNAFEVATASNLSKLYSTDDIVLERHHASLTQTLLVSNDSNKDILCGLSTVEKEHFYRQIGIIILGTEMGKHAQLVEEAQKYAAQLKVAHQSDHPFSAADSSSSSSSGSSGSGGSHHDSRKKGTSSDSDGGNISSSGSNGIAAAGVGVGNKSSSAAKAPHGGKRRKTATGEEGGGEGERGASEMLITTPTHPSAPASTSSSSSSSSSSLSGAEAAGGHGTAAAGGAKKRKGVAAAGGSDPPLTISTPSTTNASTGTSSNGTATSSTDSSSAGVVAGAGDHVGAGSGAGAGVDLPAVADREDPEWRIYFTRLLLHCADIGAQTQGLALAAKWADRCYGEFEFQRSKELLLGIKTSEFIHCIHEDSKKFESQHYFIKATVEPLWRALTDCLPKLRFAYDQLLRNRETFKEYLVANSAEKT